MDIVEKVMSDVYDNRQSYKENDYIIICNLLKEHYNKIKGNPLTNLNDKGYGRASEAADAADQREAEDEMEALADAMEQWDYADSYLGNYTEPY